MPATVLEPKVFVKAPPALWSSLPVQLLLATLALAWPAILNGFPLIYPDTVTYIEDGPLVARALFLHQLSPYYGMRSFFYSLAILPFHWNVTPWPVVLLQCSLAAWILRLVVRCIFPAPHAWRYLTLIALLSAMSSISWYCSVVLPDILGPLAYLAMFLIAFAPESLFRQEHRALHLLIVWGVASHATHLLIGALLLTLLAILLLAHGESLRRTAHISASLAAGFAIAAAAQLALHAYLYGHPSLNGERPPYLTARVIADGPGRWYLQQHCRDQHWTVCEQANNLSADPDVLLWSPDGMWQSIPDERKDDVADQEMAFVLAVVRAYPLDELRNSALHFLQQMRAFGLYDLGGEDWIADELGRVMPTSRASYRASLQARRKLPLDAFSVLQFWVVAVSAVWIVACLIRLRRRIPRLLSVLTIVIAFIVLANAALTGPLSVPDDRLQCRVIWLIPFLAGLHVLSALSLPAPGRRKT